MLITFFQYICQTDRVVQQAQGVAVNEDGSSTDPSAMIDVKTTEKGFLPPRMTSMQRDNINNSAEGLTLYSTDYKCLEWWDGESWCSA